MRYVVSKKLFSQFIYTVLSTLNKAEVFIEGYTLVKWLLIAETNKSR